MANSLKINCGVRGCTSEGPMLSIQEPYSFELLSDKRPMTVVVTKSDAPEGWAYVKVHRFIKRAFCPTHKEDARIREGEALARATASVKRPVQHNQRIRKQITRIGKDIHHGR